MHCELPADYVNSLGGRIIAARREKLRSMLPSNISCSGDSYWWDSEKHPGRGEWHLWGPRIHATASASLGGVTDTGSALVLKFTVSFAQEDTGDVFVEPGCPACEAGED